MKNAKKLIALLMSFIFILSLVACGTYNPPINTDTNSNTDTGLDQSTDSDTNSDTESDVPSDSETGFSDDAFTVMLRYNDEKYIPEEEIIVYWKNENTLESCVINERGYAGTEKLDGDYRVTLSSVPEGMAYNPNVHTATNDERHIIIDIYDLNTTRGKGRDPYNGIKLSKTAVYSVTLSSKSQIVYFDFTPTANGMYTVESWMDISEGKYNPYCDAYTGSVAYKLFDKTIDGGGAEGIYTKNFKNGIDVNDDMIGNVLTFGIHVDSESAENYPVEVVFAVQLNGGFDKITNHEYDMYVPEDPYAYKAGCITYGSDYKIVYAEEPIPGREDAYMFNADSYRLWKKEDGGDGYYHVYDVEKYSKTNYPDGYSKGYPEGYGPILYASISVPTRFLDRPFTNFEIESKPLSIKVSDDLRVNYKHFIEGYSSLATKMFDPAMGGWISSYYCFKGCPCHPDEQIYDFVCLEGCTKCLDDCRQMKKGFVLEYDEDGNPISFFEGVQAYANADGGVAVTEELKTFLYRLSVAQRYFADGEGWVETNDKISVDSSDEAQWLFACYYYEKID